MTAHPVISLSLLCKISYDLPSLYFLPLAACYIAKSFCPSSADLELRWAGICSGHTTLGCFTACCLMLWNVIVLISTLTSGVSDLPTCLEARKLMCITSWFCGILDRASAESRQGSPSISQTAGILPGAGSSVGCLWTPSVLGSYKFMQEKVKPWVSVLQCQVISLAEITSSCWWLSGVWRQPPEYGFVQVWFIH